MSILRLDPPADPIERIIFLDSVLEAVSEELDVAYSEAYFQARLQGRLDAALSAGRASRKRALAWTRRWNEATGRQVRWGDRADATSHRACSHKS